ncbi:hypothetical protein N431DRAFT_433512 [Stipitochalara longipes BDJ]|nr:hypothetical protein N431DRAFT_433512 [Stipitochalara longipes BDJ]
MSLELQYIEEEQYGLECSLNRGIFAEPKWLSDLESPSNYGTLKMSSVPRIPTTTGER